MNPRTGRFTQPDPFWNIGNMQGSSAAIAQSGNLFMFVMHNPIRWVDPTGLFASPGFAAWVNELTNRVNGQASAPSSAPASAPPASAPSSTSSSIASPGFAAWVMALGQGGSGQSSASSSTSSSSSSSSSSSTQFSITVGGTGSTMGSAGGGRLPLHIAGVPRCADDLAADSGPGIGAQFRIIIRHGENIWNARGGPRPPLRAANPVQANQVIRNTSANTTNTTSPNTRFIGNRNLSNITPDNLPPGWASTNNNGFIHIRDAQGRMRVEIHPPDRVTNFQHRHHYDTLGRSIDAQGNVVHYRSPEAHIPIGR